MEYYLVMRKEGKFAIQHNTDGSWGHYTEWNKSDVTDKYWMISLTRRIFKSPTYRNRESNGYRGLGDEGKYYQLPVRRWVNSRDLVYSLWL